MKKFLWGISPLLKNVFNENKSFKVQLSMLVKTRAKLKTALCLPKRRVSFLNPTVEPICRTLRQKLTTKLPQWLNTMIQLYPFSKSKIVTMFLKTKKPYC
ncbi:MAG: hypothetical protein DYG83_09390 [Candidatus Brocadia sp. AMX2]|nr:MAG: hypothetical protein EDM70_08105 [Candidatus Brocadia sp. AMX2]MBL1168113.1 hypothetical protein [Candidatus Brocadia sp. AMX1]MCE7867025.1 hypothetical protein [Candidatus Brocadia sp. AMX2]MCQ3917618.1 hypothetical protein [Candidatus Brocadia sp.]RIJ91138.1 MAG: hypothetical protein DB853_09355 [Candidatus Brocadia sp.]